MHGSTHGHGFVRVHVLAGILAEEFLDLFLHFGHAAHTTDQDHVLNVRHRDTCVLDGSAAGSDGALDQVFHQRFQLGAGQLQVQVLGTGGVSRDIGQVDVGLCGVRQLDLGLFSSFLQALQRQHVLGQVYALLFLELGNDVVNDALVKVFAAQEGVAVGRQHFELLFAVHVSDFDDGHVERTATQVIHGNLAVALASLVQAEGQCSSSRLVDDALDFQTCDAAGVLGGLTLCVIEVGRHGDHGFGHGLAQEVLSGLLHLAQHFCGYLRGRQLLAAHFHPGVAVVSLGDGEGHQVDVLLHFLFVELAANQTLGGKDGVLGVGNSLALGRCTHQNLTVFQVSNDRRRGARTFAVFDHAGVVAFHHSHAAVGGAQVNTDNFSHLNAPNSEICWSIGL